MKAWRDMTRDKIHQKNDGSRLEARKLLASVFKHVWLPATNFLFENWQNYRLPTSGFSLQPCLLVTHDYTIKIDLLQIQYRYSTDVLLTVKSISVNLRSHSANAPPHPSRVQTAIWTHQPAFEKYSLLGRQKLWTAAAALNMQSPESSEK